MSDTPFINDPENFRPRNPSESERIGRQQRPGARDFGSIDEIMDRLRRSEQRQHNANARASGRAAGATRESAGYRQERARREARREARRPERGGPAGPLPGTPGYGGPPPYTPPPGSVPNPRPGTYTPPIPGGGIAARVPGGPGFPSQWTPAPAMVLVLGAILIGVGLITGQQISGGIVNLFWNPIQNLNVQTVWRGLSAAMGEGLFVLVLYILANLSDELARIAVVFELMMFLVLFIMHPNILVTLLHVVKGLTGG